MKAKSKITVTILGLTSLVVPVVATAPYIAIVNSNKSQSIYDIIKQIDLFSNKIKGSKDILPSSLTNETIGSNITGLPFNSGTTYTYHIDAVNDQNGEAKVVIIVHQGSLGISSQPIVIKGFETLQDQVNNLANKIPNVIAKDNSDVYAIQMTSNNISNYISTLPTLPNGFEYQYTISNNQAAGTLAGTLTLAIQVKNTTVNITSTVIKTFSLNGFKQGTVSQYSSSSSSPISGIPNTLRVVVPLNYSLVSFLNAASQISNWMPADGLIGDVLFLNTGNSATWNGGNSSTTGNFVTANNPASASATSTSVQIFYNTGGTSTSSFNIQVSGFSSIQNYLNPILNGITSLSTTAIASSTLPTVVTNANIANYITLPTAGQGYTFSASIVSSDNPAGNLTISLSATSYGSTITKTQNIVVSGFLTTQQYVNNLANNITSVSAQTNSGEIYPVQVTNSNVATYISTLPALPTGYEYQYTISNNQAAGTLAGTLTLAIQVKNTTSNITSTVTKTFNLTGFKKGTISTFGRDTSNSSINNIMIIVPLNYSLVSFLYAASKINNNGTHTSSQSQHIGQVLILNSESSNAIWWAVPQNPTNAIATTTNVAINVQGSNTSAAPLVYTMAVNGFTSIQAYLQPILSAITSLSTTSAAKNVLPSTINSSNLSSYITLPTANEGYSFAAAVISNDDAAGTLTVSLSATSYGSTVTKSENITISGFETQQDQVDSLVNKITDVSAKNNSSMYAIQMTSDNISNYISTLPALPSGFEYQYTISNNQATGTLAGTLTLAIQVKNTTANITSTVIKTFSLSGFKKGTVSQYSSSSSISGIANTLKVVVPLNYSIVSFLYAASQISNWMPADGLIGDVLFLNTGNSATWSGGNSSTTGNFVTANNPSSATSTSSTVEIYYNDGSASFSVQVNGFSSIQTYLQPIVNAITSLNTTSAAKTVLPSNVNSSNLSSYITLPTAGQGYTFSASIVSSDNAAGTLTISLSATSYGSTITKTQNIIVSGFLTIQQYVNNLANNITSVSAQGNSGIYAIQVTNSNVATYISTLPTLPTGYEYQYTISNNQAAGTLVGTLTLAIQVKNTTANITSTVIKTFSLSGFKQGTVSQVTTSTTASLAQNLRVVVPLNYSLVDFLNAASNRSPSSMQNWMPANGLIGNVLFLNTGNSATWSGTNQSSNGNRAIVNNPASATSASTSVQIFYNTGGTSTSSFNIQVSGFNSIQAYLNPILDGITSLSTTTIANTLPSTITNSNLTSYITLPANGNGYTFSASVVSVSDTNGTLTVSLSATSYGSTVTKSDNITINGFLNSQLFLNNVINQVNNANITGSDKELVINLNSDNIGSYLNNLPKFDGVTYTYNIPSKNDIPNSNYLDGQVPITITAHFDGATNTSKSILVTGFQSGKTYMQNYFNNYKYTFKGTTSTTAGEIPGVLPSSVNIGNIQSISNIPMNVFGWPIVWWEVSSSGDNPVNNIPSISVQVQGPWLQYYDFNITSPNLITYQDIVRKNIYIKSNLPNNLSLSSFSKGSDISWFFDNIVLQQDPTAKIKIISTGINTYVSEGSTSLAQKFLIHFDIVIQTNSTTSTKTWTISYYFGIGNI